MRKNVDPTPGTPPTSCSKEIKKIPNVSMSSSIQKSVKFDEEAHNEDNDLAEKENKSYAFGFNPSDGHADVLRKTLTIYKLGPKENRNNIGVKLNVFDVMKRRASLLPPPPQMKHKEENIPQTRRKRRESMAISFNSPSNVKPRKESPKPVQRTSGFTPFKGVDRKEIKFTVTYKDQIYTKSFMESKTLQDLYSWIRQQLLQQDILSPGTELMLSHNNLSFPLKANTANKALGNLPATSFLCEEIKKENQGSTGEGNSRYDTRFSLPMDLRELEALNPVQYLVRFCKLSSTWKAFYSKTFCQNDKDKDGLLTYKELSAAMERLFVELAYPLLRRCLFLMGLDPKSAKPLLDGQFFLCEENGDGQNGVKDYEKLLGEGRILPWQSRLSVTVDVFVSICALANRIICRETKIDDIHVDTIRQKGTELEDADFYDIEGKLRNFNLHPLTKRLLLYIRK